MAKRILGVSRSPRFSPNSISRDEAIFSAVATILATMGYEVERVVEDDLIVCPENERIFTMARDERVLRLLAEAETKGCLVLNSARSLLRADRESMTSVFEQNGVPVPLSPVIYRQKEGLLVPFFRNGASRIGPFPFWLKRSAACAQSVGDVCFVRSQLELNEALLSYQKRGIDEVLASEHLVGDLVKFYGVQGTDFFYCYYPTAENDFSKFGLEKINGLPSGFPLDRVKLKECADRAAVLCGITIYGGDCIVSDSGDFAIIDFNDWPSYSRCCRSAAQAIAEKINNDMA